MLVMHLQAFTNSAYFKLLARVNSNKNKRTRSTQTRDREIAAGDSPIPYLEEKLMCPSRLKKHPRRPYSSVPSNDEMWNLASREALLAGKTPSHH
jgi:hypothetical protein